MVALSRRRRLARLLCRTPAWGPLSDAMGVLVCDLPGESRDDTTVQPSPRVFLAERRGRSLPDAQHRPPALVLPPPFRLPPENEGGPGVCPGFARRAQSHPERPRDFGRAPDG